MKPGVRENEISAEIEYQMRKRGASGPAFRDDCGIRTTSRAATRQTHG